MQIHIVFFNKRVQLYVINIMLYKIGHSSDLLAVCIKFIIQLKFCGREVWWRGGGVIGHVMKCPLELYLFSSKLSANNETNKNSRD